MFTRKSEIIFIGSGKVAHTLIPSLIEKNYPVKGIISKSLKPAERLAKKYQIRFCSNHISKIPDVINIFIIAVPDNQIKSVAGELSNLDLHFKSSLFIHTSGSENTDALKALEKKGGMTASFHIMQTFPALKKVDITNSFAAIETNNSIAEKYLFSLVRSLRLKGFKLSKEDKVYYHLAGVFASNFLNANLFSSEKMLRNTGLERNQYDLLEPILKAALANIKNSGVGNSLSGPVERGDYLTISKHISAIKKLKSNHRKILLHSYISQSLVLLEVILKHNKKLSAGQRMVRRILVREIKKI